jgi:hypothetical protein
MHIGLRQQLADRKPKAQSERVEDHEEDAKTANQDDLRGLSCHGNLLPAAA